VDDFGTSSRNGERHLGLLQSQVNPCDCHSPPSPVSSVSKLCEVVDKVTLILVKFVVNGVTCGYTVDVRPSAVEQAAFLVNETSSC